ncbi:hypothetical protein C7S16_3195 [Burkholderia thailandensis]|uniref:Uncharacterized protein n=1 Tax=Burkholderia thailandensis TaxID=57975 RepID=A0AAW9CZK8_BURTH|nr:hypothetical protein [Burkholderia thailandensis]
MIRDWLARSVVEYLKSAPLWIALRHAAYLRYDTSAAANR